MNPRSHSPSSAALRTALVALVPLGAWWSGLLAGTMGGGVPVDPPIENELVVRPSTGHSSADIVDGLTAAGLTSVSVSDEISGRNTFLITHIPQAGMDLPQLEAVLDGLVANGIATWAEVNYQSQTAEGKTDSLWVTGIGLEEWFNQQYLVTTLGLPAAHQRTLGQGVIVAVLDSGMDASHPSIAGPIAPGAWSFLTDSPNVTDSGNGIDDDGDGLVDEGVGHGTFVASLIRLVAPQSRLLPIQVLDSEGRADNFHVAKSMYYAIDQGAHVINMSMGTTYRSAAMEEATAEAFDKGIMVVGSMGNYGVDEPREFPGSDGNAVGVAATNHADLVAPFSNFGPRTDFCAPGTSLSRSGSPQPGFSVIGALPGGAIAAWQGTSFAAALVSGTAALVRAQHPEWPSQTVPPNAVVDAMIGLLGAGAVDITALNPSYEGDIGAGRIDAGASSLLSPPAPELGDLDGDGQVSGADLGLLLGSWGPCGSCPADLDFDGTVNGADLGLLLGNWS